MIFLINFKQQKKITMKRFLILLFIVTRLIGYGQAIIGMSPVFSFTPANAGTPSSSVNFGDTVYLQVSVKNHGNAYFSNWISLQAFRDTTNGVLCDSTNIFLSLQPNDSASQIITFVPSFGPNAYKSAGNGNTIVVWPYIKMGGGIQGDSVRPVLWINSINRVSEFENNSFKLYPNPVINSLTIKSQSNADYKKIIIYDVFARKVKELTFIETIDVSDLKSGSYWMIISSESKSYRINFIKE